MTATVDIIEQVTLEQCLEGMEALPRDGQKSAVCRERSICTGVQYV